MASHHETNAKGVKPGDVQGPGSPSSVGKLNVSYTTSTDIQGPAPVTRPSQEPSPSSQEPPLDSPNVPNPMGPSTTPQY